MGQSRHRKTQVLVDLSALQHNCRVLMSMSSGAWFCPMIKADGYGHGANAVCFALAQVGVKQVGVALVEEGVLLREAGVSQLDVIVYGFFDADSLRVCHQHNLIAVIADEESLHALIQLPSHQRPAFHLKFNTGMNRLGLTCDRAHQVKAQLQENGCEALLRGICTHFAVGEDWGIKGGVTETQSQKFNFVVDVFSQTQIQIHALNSAALIQRSQHPISEYAGWGVRPGLAIYGEAPRGVTLPSGLQLKRVMSWISHIEQVQLIEPGMGVSYNHLWRAQRPSTIGVVPVGYADGYSRRLTGKAQVLVQGQKAPIVGAICMDYLMVDLTDLKASSGHWHGAEVCLLGQQGLECISAEELAQLSGTISYEILTSVSQRVPRLHMEG